MMQLIFSFFSNYLIEFMSFLLGLGLVIRFMAFKQSKYDQFYFSTFTRELEHNVDQDKNRSRNVGEIDSYLNDILSRVSTKLPDRSLRFDDQKAIAEKNKMQDAREEGINAEPIGLRTRVGDNDKPKDEKDKYISLRDYVGGSQALKSSLLAESSVFMNPSPPNFTELTNRIMNQDKSWSKLKKVIPIDIVIRMVDILPGLFIVFGVFGTFIGISMALPEIVKLDFNDIEGSSVVLNTFVLSVTYAMKTSIAGIFFSILMTILNTAYPIKEVRHRIFKKMETSLQTLWYHIHSDESSEKQMVKNFSQMLDVLNEISSKLPTKPNDNQKAS